MQINKLLEKILTDCSGKSESLSNAVEDALSMLVQSVISKHFSTQLALCSLMRDKVFCVVELCLESERHFLADTAMVVLQELLTYVGKYGGENLVESADQNMITQLLHTLHNLPFWSNNPTLQCRCFTIILKYVNGTDSTFTSSAIQSILELAISTHCAPACRPDVKMAARTTSIQCVTSFCQSRNCKDSQSCDYREFQKSQHHGSKLKSSQNDIFELLAIFSNKLKSITSSPDDSSPIILVLDAIYAILLSQEFGQIGPNVFEVLWKNVLPLIVNILGDPNHAASHVQKTPEFHKISENWGRGVTGATVNLKHTENVLVIAHRICDEFLRLFGPLTAMRSSLEALFHRFLLFHPQGGRVEALRSLKHILENPARVMCLVNFDSESGCWDFNLYRIIIDCLLECMEKKQSQQYAAICLNSFLCTLIEFCEDNSKYSEKCLSETTAYLINAKYPRLEAVNEDSSNINKLLSTDEPEDVKDGANILLDGDEQKVHDSLFSLAERLESKFDEDQSEPDGVINYLTQIRKTWRHDLKQAASSPLANKSPFQRSCSFEDRELNSAKSFVELFMGNLPKWSLVKNTIELDVSLQNFAVATFKDFMSKQLNLLGIRGSMYEIAFYNADALYLLTYACLDIFCCLDRAENSCVTNLHNPSRTQEFFVDEVLNVGIIVYISESFLKSTYSTLLDRLGKDSKNHLLDPSKTMISLMEDYSGCKGKMLSDYLMLSQLAKPNRRTDRQMAAMKICRKILSTSWRDFVKCLSHTLDSQPSAQSSSLECFQKLLMLTDLLDMKDCSGHIFRVLIESSCPLEDLRLCQSMKNARKTSPSSEKKFLSKNSKLASFGSKIFLLSGNGGKGLQLYFLQAKSIQLVLDNALKIGSCNPSCWTSVTRCIQYVVEFERAVFTSTAATPVPQPRIKSSRYFNAPFSTTERLAANCDEGVDWAASTLSSTLSSSAGFFGQTVDDVLSDTSESRRGVGVAVDEKRHSAELIARLVGVLSAKVDRLYEDCIHCLNLSSLKEFCKALVLASQSNLFYGFSKSSANLDSSQLHADGMFLEQLSNILIRLSRSARPLVHIMSVWGLVAPHFIEAACASDTAISQKTAELLCEIMSVLLENSPGFDLSSFHFNESLLQPFQTILCLELCTEQCADVIFCSIAELVECHKKEIHAGWKSLFGALRAGRSVSLIAQNSADSSGRLRHLHSAFVDVFSTFLKADNSQVFCAAAGECINCLLRFLAADHTLDHCRLVTHPHSDENAEGTTQSVALSHFGTSPDLPKTSLCFLRQCHILLLSLFECGSDHFAVHLIHRFTDKNHSNEKVDWHLEEPGGKKCVLDFGSLPSLAGFLEECQAKWFDWNFSPHFLETRQEELPLPLPWSAMSIGRRLICEVWIDLVEGLIGSILTAPSNLQPEVIECVFNMLETFLNAPGLHFGAYCMNHLLLPMMQRWLRRETNFHSNLHEWRENEFAVRNFKQCVGLTVEIVVKYIKAEPTATCNSLLLTQIFDLLTECISKASEFIARLGCASLRHVIDSLKSDFTTHNHWPLVCKCLWRINAVTLHPLRLLMSCFEENSLRYDGGAAWSVQVAVRRDSNPTEAARLRVLAQQVFLADGQKYEENLEDHPDQLSRSFRSVVFVLTPADSSDESSVVRLPFRKLVISLLAHQMYLQTVGRILTEGTSVKLPSSSTTLTRHVAMEKNSESHSGLPGCLKSMSVEQTCALLSCLDASFVAAQKFDARPGLKFLIQKVFSSPVSANLYKQLVTCWSFQLTALYHLGVEPFLFDFATYSTSDLKRMVDDDSPIDFYAASSSGDDLDAIELRVRFYFRVLSRRYARVCVTFGAGVSLKGSLSLSFLPLRSTVVVALAQPLLGSLSNDSSSPSTSSLTTSRPLTPFKSPTGLPSPSLTMQPTIPAAPSPRGLYFESLPPFNSPPPDERPTTPPIDSRESLRYGGTDVTTTVGSYNGVVETPAFSTVRSATSEAGCRRREEGAALPADGVESIYALATSDQLQLCLQGYRLSKDRQKHTNPSVLEESKNFLDIETCGSACAASRKNPFDPTVIQVGWQSDFSKTLETYEDPSLKDEAASSLVRDTDAACLAWSEIVISLPRLILALPEDRHLKLFLPLIFQPLNQNVFSSNSKLVKLFLADFLYRLAEAYRFFN